LTLQTSRMLILILPPDDDELYDGLLTGCYCSYGYWFIQLWLLNLASTTLTAATIATTDYCLLQLLPHTATTDYSRFMDCQATDWTDWGNRLNWLPQEGYWQLLKATARATDSYSWYYWIIQLQLRQLTQPAWGWLILTEGTETDSYWRDWLRLTEGTETDRVLYFVFLSFFLYFVYLSSVFCIFYFLLKGTDMLLFQYSVFFTIKSSAP